MKHKIRTPLEMKVPVGVGFFDPFILLVLQAQRNDLFFLLNGCHLGSPRVSLVFKEGVVIEADRKVAYLRRDVSGSFSHS